MKQHRTSMAQLRWKCRRGMKELDMLFSYFLDNYYEHDDSEHQQAFLQLINTQDPIINDYLFGRRRPPTQAIADIINVMRQYQQSHR